MHRTTFQATSVLFFFVVNWSKVGPCYRLGQWTTDNLLTSFVLLPLAPVGVFLGRYLHDRMETSTSSASSPADQTPRHRRPVVREPIDDQNRRISCSVDSLPKRNVLEPPAGSSATSTL